MKLFFRWKEWKWIPTWRPFTIFNRTQWYRIYIGPIEVRIYQSEMRNQ